MIPGGGNHRYKVQRRARAAIFEEAVGRLVRLEQSSGNPADDGKEVTEGRSCRDAELGSPPRSSLQLCIPPSIPPSGFTGEEAVAQGLPDSW